MLTILKEIQAWWWLDMIAEGTYPSELLPEHLREVYLENLKQGGCQMTKKVRVKAVFCEVYSRVVGYFRPVFNWHPGKRLEFEERKKTGFKPT